MFMTTLLMVGCKDDVIDSLANGYIAVGEPIMFTTLVPDIESSTRATEEEWKTEVGSFHPVNLEYTFNVEMWKKGALTASGSSQYIPVSTLEDGQRVYSSDGTLQNKENPFYWPDNVNEWGFKATTNSSASVEPDQHTQQLWLKQDKLEGYSYLPLWNETVNGETDNLNEINYRTSKQWYADNKKAMTLSGLMVDEGSNGEEYKKIPLYMQHKRSWITIILLAGEGVKRDALKFSAAEENLKMSVYSYAEGASDPVIIDKAWPKEVLIDYPKDKNGDEEYNVSSTRYDAIVEPHNYAANKDEEAIARVNLSNQHFTFYAGNDSRFLIGTDTEKAEAENAYNLEAGKHLTIYVTLSRQSRKILIRAWIEDWTEVATSTICDDYGQNGDPIVIKNREDLVSFLEDLKKNKQGSVALVQPTELNLDYKEEDGTEVSWPQSYSLNATLNLAGCTLKTKSKLFQNITSSGNLVNGTVEMMDGATVSCAIADNNDGTIERVNVTTKTGENSTAKATLAGLVGKNCGTIYQCNSSLPVYATEVTTIPGNNENESFEGYIGGIAAVSQSHDASSMAVIDGCMVNASVNGNIEAIMGGGIVGYATGRVSNNTYEYGITVSQSPTNYKNIFVTATDLRTSGNAWPTSVKNPTVSPDESDITNPNNYTGMKFDAVIDCQKELDLLMTSSAYNAPGKNYRISKSFMVSSSNTESESWSHGFVQADNYAAGANNVSFNLDGNNKTITLTGTKTVKTTRGTNLSNGDPTTYTTAPMLFNYVLGEIKDLILYLEKPIVASPSENTVEKDGVSTTVYNAAEAIAPLAYAVYGENGKLTNIKVKAKTDTETPENDAYVQASTPAGLVVWAWGGATISDCKVNVPVRMWLPEDMGNDAKHYAGGIVANAAVASIIRCDYLGNSEKSLTGAETSTSAMKSGNYFYGGIVGGTAINGSEKPKLYIVDCSSWYITSPVSDNDHSSKGAIIAYPCYADTDASKKITNGMDGQRPSEGNWWPTNSKGAHTWAEGLNEEMVVGKRNTIDPSSDIDF